MTRGRYKETLKTVAHLRKNNSISYYTTDLQSILTEIRTTQTQCVNLLIVGENRLGITFDKKLI